MIAATVCWNAFRRHGTRSGKKGRQTRGAGAAGGKSVFDAPSEKAASRLFLFLLNAVSYPLIRFQFSPFIC